MQHEDLVQMLYKLAFGAGARIDFHTGVESVRPGDPSPSVVLASGEVVTADVVIGADGSNGVTRSVILGEEDPWVRPGGLTVYIGAASTHEMLKDPELSALVNAEEVSLYADVLAKFLTLCSGLYGWETIPS